MSKHTELPWKIMGNEARGFQIHTDYANGKPAPHLNHWIATMRCESCPNEKEANAQFLVSAANSHYPMLEALKKARHLLSNLSFHLERKGDVGVSQEVDENITELDHAIKLGEK